jgi:CubicO group peptidase (beta-lactamase class C family)
LSANEHDHGASRTKSPLKRARKKAKPSWRRRSPSVLARNIDASDKSARDGKLKPVKTPITPLLRWISTVFAATLTITIHVPLALSQSSTPRDKGKPAIAISPEKIDRTVAAAMLAFQVPGVAVGIVKDGKLIFSKGYGVREVDKPGRIDADTLFQIGSNTKAFTAAALAILIDEGKIQWDDKVIDHLPEFRLYDPYVTREFTIRDLLTHRSGLGLGAGDLMFFPPTDMTRAEIIHGLRYLKPASSFRSKYDYDNLLYMVAGQIIPQVTGKSWEEFLTEKIIGPLHMTPCAASYGRITDRSNLAAPHVVTNGELKAVAVLNMDTIGPAGTINCSIRGMAEWLKTQLAAGKTTSGQQLFSADRSKEMWTLITPTPASPLLSTMYNAHFSGYGLGWFLSDAHGYERVYHEGGVLGSVTWVSMIPELNLGVLVFTNQQNDAAIEAIGGQILDTYLGVASRDWVAIAKQFMDERDSEASSVENATAEVVARAGPPLLPLDAYVGTYHDPWRGDAFVRKEGNRLVLRVSRTEFLEGPLIPYSGNVFIVRWNDRSLGADAYVRFEQGFSEQIVGVSLRAVSPNTDFSFDFQDLDFTKIESTVAERHGGSLLPQ